MPSGKKGTRVNGSKRMSRLRPKTTNKGTKSAIDSTEKYVEKQYKAGKLTRDQYLDEMRMISERRHAEAMGETADKMSMSSSKWR